MYTILIHFYIKTHFQVADDLQRELQTRQDKLASFHLTAQPLPILVGSDIGTIESCYVSVNDILYKVDTPLRAVDLCFKIFHVMNASYPPEAETAWTFIEQVVYNFPKTKTYVFVTSLMSDVLKLNSEN